MQLKELLEKLKHLEDKGDWRVCVPISGVGCIGAHPVADIVSVGQGIDWDHGKIMLWPEIPLFKKPQKPKKVKQEKNK